MNRPQRMDLRARLNKKMWEDALETVRKAFNAGWLSEYDSDFYVQQLSAWQMVGDEYGPTIKQFNYLRQLAVEAAKAGY